jgi:predicted dehydrogenase
MGTEAALRIPSTECWNGGFTAPMKLYKDVAGVQVEMEIPLIPAKKGFKGLFYQKIRSFIDAIKNDSPPSVPSKEIIINQAIIHAIVVSAEQGKEVEVALPEDVI